MHQHVNRSQQHNAGGRCGKAVIPNRAHVKLFCIHGGHAVWSCCSDVAGRIEISAQNHNYAVDPETLPEGVEVTHINLNDGTCAGMVYAEKRAMAIQYHPEASPGPHDSDVCFEQFMDMIRKEKQGQGGYTSSETAAEHIGAKA